MGILNQLPNRLYTKQRGVSHLEEHVDINAIGSAYEYAIRLGDMDDFNFQVEVTEDEGRYSNEYGDKTLVIQGVSEKAARGTMTLAQHTSFAYRAALMGREVAFIQEAMSGVEFVVDEGKIKSLDGYDLTLDEVTKAGGEPAILNVDYTWDGPSGFIQANPGVSLVGAFSRPAIANETAIGIAAGDMPRGRLTYRSTAKDGKRSLIVLHDVQFSPNGELNLISEGYATIPVKFVAYPVSGKQPGYEYGFMRDIS